MSLPLFGPGGNCNLFTEKGYKSTAQAPVFVESMGLDIYEVEFGRGVRMSDENADLIYKNSKKKNIGLSVHAPYYISLSSIEEEKRLRSVNYILETCEMAEKIGAQRVVIHSGSCGKLSREEALSLAKDTLQKAIDVIDEMKLSHIILCPETMGKINQLGDLDEVMQLCSLDERLLPTIDFGHLNARTFGGIKDISDYEKILDTIENKLGNFRLRNIHSHFSKIEYTQKGGEKQHLTFEDEIYGPDFEPLAELIYKKSMSPWIICESKGTQSIDALAMKNIYNNIKENN